MSRYQLGLHEAPKGIGMSEREQVTRQRTFIALRIFDGYVTSSLGLPRSLRVFDALGNCTDGPHIASVQMLAAANANLELIEVLGNAREIIFFNSSMTQIEESHMTSAENLREVSGALDQWASKHGALLQSSDGTFANSSRYVGAAVLMFTHTDLCL